MSLNPYLANKLVDLFLRESKIESCIEFGNQRFMIDKSDALPLFSETDSSKVLKILDSQEDKNALYDLTRLFYKNLGIKQYQTIDLNGLDGAHKFDLNLELKEHYGFKEVFNLVINNGTSEHVFNQKNIFLNSHNLASNKGIMVHMLPFFSWVNHGFYNFNPILFLDLAAVNDYEILDFSIGNRNKELIKGKKAEISKLSKTQQGKGLKQFFSHENSIIVKPTLKQNLKKPLRYVLERLKSYTTSSKDLTYEELSENIVFPYKGKNLYYQMLKAFRSTEQTSSNPFSDLSILVIFKKKSMEPFKVPLQGKYQEDY